MTHHSIANFPSIGGCAGSIMEILDDDPMGSKARHAEWLEMVNRDIREPSIFVDELRAIEAGAPLPADLAIGILPGIGKPAVLLEHSGEGLPATAADSKSLRPASSQLPVEDWASVASVQSLESALLPFQRALSEFLEHMEKYKKLNPPSATPLDTQHDPPLPVSGKLETKDTHVY